MAKLCKKCWSISQDFGKTKSFDTPLSDAGFFLNRRKHEDTWVPHNFSILKVLGGKSLKINSTIIPNFVIPNPLTSKLAKDAATKKAAKTNALLAMFYPLLVVHTLGDTEQNAGQGGTSLGMAASHPITSVKHLVHQGPSTSFNTRLTVKTETVSRAEWTLLRLYHQQHTTEYKEQHLGPAVPYNNG